jgi:hypothetical protein
MKDNLVKDVHAIEAHREGRQHGDMMEIEIIKKLNQCVVESGGNIVGAFSTSHSMVSAFPAMSLNSALGFRERINVAAVAGLNGIQRFVRLTRTSEYDTKVACCH